MPLWFELIVIALVAYALGVTLGWLAWGRGSRRRARRGQEKSE